MALYFQQCSGLPRSASIDARAGIYRCGIPFSHGLGFDPDMDHQLEANSRLLAAATRGDLTHAMLSLGDGADPSHADPGSGKTSLHSAARSCHLQMLELLLSAGARANVVDAEGRTPLCEAVLAGSLSAVQLLMRYGATPWPAAASPSQKQQEQAALQEGAGAPADQDAQFQLLKSTCPLCAAAAVARWPLVAALLAAVPPDYHSIPAVLSSLRFLIWALACHKAFPRDVMAALPRSLPRCVVDAVRPAHLASTPLVLATGNDQQELMQWLMQRGADPDLGAPLLLCAGRFCRGSRSCCVNCLLRLGARPHVAWHDQPSDSPLMLATRGDCFTHVHCLVAYGGDVGGEADRVRRELLSPPEWEACLPSLEATHGHLRRGDAADRSCPCGVQHASWPGMWPLDGDSDARCTAVGEEEVEEEEQGAMPAAGSVGNSCYNNLSADDAWYRQNVRLLSQLQDGAELAACKQSCSEMWRYGCSVVSAQLGHGHADSGSYTQMAAHSLMPQLVLDAMQDVASGWLEAALRCRQQRLLRVALYDDAVAKGCMLLQRKRVAALAALGGQGLSTSSGADSQAFCNAAGMEWEPSAVDTDMGDAAASGAGAEPGCCSSGAGGGSMGLLPELKMEILAMAGLAPPRVAARVGQIQAERMRCYCRGCSTSRRSSVESERQC